MRSHVLVLFVLLLAAAIPFLADVSVAFAQSSGASLSGRVTDASGAPIGDALVRIVEVDRSAVSGVDGHFAFAHLPRGTYRLYVQRLGFRPLMRTITLSEAPAVHDAVLTASLVEISPLQVTAGPHATSALESPLPLGTIEPEALRTGRRPSLGETVAQLPGLRSWSTGSGIGKPTIRGLRSDRVLILAGSQRLENQQWGDEHGPNLDLTDAERIEVIRGPASVLYGSDALGGVVHVLPRPLPTAYDTPPRIGGSAALGFDSNGRVPEGALAVETAAGGFGVRTRVSGRAADDLSTPDGTLFNSSATQTAAGGAIAWRGAVGTLGAHYSYDDERIEIHEDPAEDPLATPFQKIRDHRARLESAVPLGAGHLEANAGYEENRRQEFEAEDEPDPALVLRSTSWSGGARWHPDEIGSWHPTIGVSILSTAVRTGGEEVLVPPSDAIDAGVFALANTNAGAFGLSAGVRYDHRDLDVADEPALGVAQQTRRYDAITGTAGALWRIAEPLALALNFGSGFRAPSSFDLFANGVHEGTVAFERGNPNLDVERSFNVDLALRGQSERWRGEVGGFVNLVNDFIYSRPTGTFDPGSGFEIFDVTQGDARLWGLEAHGEVHPTGPLHVHAAVDYVVGDNTSLGTPLPWMPPFRALYGVRWEAERAGTFAGWRVALDGESNARQDRLDPSDVATPAYTLAHAGAGMDWAVEGREIGLDVQVRNLIDERYTDFLSRYKLYAIAPGRNLVVRLTTRF